MNDYDIRDDRFRAVIIGHVRLEKLWTGARWAEGPVYVPSARHLLFSDIPNNRLIRFCEDDGKTSVFETPVGYHNGHTLDRQGRIIACEHGGRRVSRLDYDGVWRPLAERFEGKRFNSPNDVVVKSDGAIWFTDPTYGIDSAYEGAHAESEIGASNVYRLDPATGAVTAVVTGLVRPNGLAFSPDESLLYVADTGASHVPGTPVAIHAYAVAGDGAGVARKGIFARCDAGFYDGFRVDWLGNIWTSTGDSVHCYAPDGVLLGRIPIPELVSNVCFGGPKRNRLYITAQTSLFAIFLNTHPAGWRPA